MHCHGYGLATPLKSPLSFRKARMIRNHKGFTLIELLIVVVIIGILAAIAIPKFANTKNKAYITAMKSDLRNLVTAEEAFFADSSAYTATLGQLKYQNSTAVNPPAITSATTTHTQLAGSTCGISVNTTNPLQAGATDGQGVCQ